MFYRPLMWVALSALIPLGLGARLVASGAGFGGKIKVVGAQPPGDEDDEDRRERLILAERALTENCLICHAATMIEGQRLTAPQWRAEVEKMVGWGSPLPPDRMGELAAFLASNSKSDAPAATPARLSVPALEAFETARDTASAVTGDAARGHATYKSQCLNCHAEAAVGGDLGPNLVAKPILTQWDEYASIMRTGRRRMPGFKLVLDAQAERDVLVWLRGLRGPSGYQAPPVAAKPH